MGQTLEYLLRLQDSFSGPLKHARDEQGKFTAGTKKFGESASAVNSLSGAFVGLAAKIGAAFTAYKALEVGFAGFKHALSVASEMETTQTAFKTMLGSSAAMLETLGDIKKLAMETPFEFPELATAGKMLLAFGETAKSIPDTLRRIGDVSSAIAAPIGEIAEIYGKARTQGQLFAEDINQLTGRGIPIIREFAKILGLPEGAIKKLAEEGKITFPLLDQAFRNLTGNGGQFFNMMAEQAKTSAGLWSTLQDGVNELFLALGTPLNDAIKPVLTDAISLADQLKPVVADIGQHMGVALSAVRDFIAEAKEGSGMASAMGDALWAMLQNVASKMMLPFKAAWAGAASLGTDLIAWLTPVGEWLAAKMESAAMAFGRVLMKQLAEVFEALPLHMGDAAALSLNKSAKAAGQAASVANRRATNAEKNIRAPTAEGVAGAVDNAADAARGVVIDGLAAAQAKADKQEEAKKAETKGFDDQIGSFYEAKSAPKSDPFSDESKKQVQDNLKINREVEQQKRERDHARGVHFKDWNKTKVDTTSIAASTDAPGLAAALAGAAAPKATTKPGAKTPSVGQGAGGMGKSPIDRGMTPGGRIASPLDAIRRMMGGGDESAAAGSVPSGTGGIRRHMMGGGLDQFHRNQVRDGSAATAFGAGSLSRRKSTPTVPSPGTARRSQERREAAASQARESSGTHPLMALVKDMQTKLNTLAVAK